MAEDEGRGVEGQKSSHIGEVHRILPDFSLLLVVRRGYIFGERVKKLRLHSVEEHVKKST